MKRRLVFPAIVALAALTAACSSDSKSDSVSSVAADTVAADTVATATTAAADGELPTAAAVDIAQFRFGPADIHVAAGGTVTWTNSDNQKHTATASGTFDTGAIEVDASAEQTFDTAGTYAYICAFHPFMKGTVVVGS